jgi:hypothetical protein
MFIVRERLGFRAPRNTLKPRLVNKAGFEFSTLTCTWEGRAFNIIIQSDVLSTVVDALK